MAHNIHRYHRAMLRFIINPSDITTLFLPIVPHSSRLHSFERSQSSFIKASDAREGVNASLASFRTDERRCKSREVEVQKTQITEKNGKVFQSSSKITRKESAENEVGITIKSFRTLLKERREDFSLWLKQLTADGNYNSAEIEITEISIDLGHLYMRTAYEVPTRSFVPTFRSMFCRIHSCSHQEGNPEWSLRDYVNGIFPAGVLHIVLQCVKYKCIRSTPNCAWKLYDEEIVALDTSVYWFREFSTLASRCY